MAGITGRIFVYIWHDCLAKRIDIFNRIRYVSNKKQLAKYVQGFICQSNDSFLQHRSNSRFFQEYPRVYSGNGI